MKVSIITVCYNSDSTVRDTIESVIKQNYRNIEYIIIDGASTDGTMDIVKEYNDRIDVIVSEPDLGIYDAMNKGIQLATGDIVGFLNADDFYVDESAVCQLIERMVTTGSDTVFADLIIVDAKNTDCVLRYYDSSTFHPRRLRYGWMPAHPTFLVKRRLYDECGIFSLDYQIASDFEMVARLLYKNRASYSYLPSVVVKMRTGGISTNGLRSSWRLNTEIVRACRANGIKTSLPRVLLKVPAKLIEYLRKPM